MATEISRKSFLRLGAGLAAAAAAAGEAQAQYKSSKAAPLPKGPTRTLIKGADVLTMEKGKADLLGYDVLLDGGKIAAVEKTIPAGGAASGAEIVNGQGKVLMPGFTDGFRHNWQSVNTGRILKTDNSYPRYYDSYTPQVPLVMTPEDYYFSEYIGGIEAINAGYTNVINFAHAHFTESRLVAAVEGYKASGAGGLFCFTLEGDRQQGASPEETRRLRTQTQSQPLPDAVYQRGAMIRDKYLSDPNADLVFGLSNNRHVGLPPQQVVDHFKKMRALNPKLIIQHYSRPDVMPPAGRLQSLTQMYEAGIFGPDLLFSHGLTITDDELMLMAKTGVSASSAPLIEMSYDEKMSCIHARAKHFGVPAGFGFDTPMEAVRDPFEMLRMGFAILFKEAQSWKISESLTSEDVLAWQTSVGAEASKRGDVTGTVTVGKRADVILVDISHFGVPTNGTLADKVVNFCSLRDIDSVWIGGKRRKKDGEMIGVDWARLKAERTQRDDRIWAALGKPQWGLNGT